MKCLKPLLACLSLIGMIASVCYAEDRLKPAEPHLDELKQVVRPPSIGGLAFNGKEVWGVIYHGNGRYIVVDSDLRGWRLSGTVPHHLAIKVGAGAFGSPGGACFAEGDLWIAGSYGDSIACIDTKRWKVVRAFKGEQRDHEASQSYSGIAHDGEHLWIAWHWFNYDLPTSKTQLLLKVNPKSGKVVAEYPLPAGEQADGTHGLAWDGTQLWHIKDTRLSAIDPATGKVVREYTLSSLTRPSGLTWIGDALLIAEFRGKMWRLPFGNARGHAREGSEFGAAGSDGQ